MITYLRSIASCVSKMAKQVKVLTQQTEFNPQVGKNQVHIPAWFKSTPMNTAAHVLTHIHTYI